MRKPFRYVRPGSLAIIAIMVAALMVSAALLEVRNTRDALLSLLAEKGRIAAGQIERGAMLALRAMDETEANLAARLLTVARTTAQLEAFTKLGHTALEKLARENRVHAIHLVSQDGRMEISSRPTQHFERRPHPDFRDLFPSLFSQEGEEAILGIHLSSADGTSRFAVGVRRQGGGIVVCSIDAATLLELRKTFGLGRLIQDVGNVPGVSYVMIQDEEGILTATRNIVGAKRVADDPFLAERWQNGKDATRTVSFEGQDVFEVVKAITLEGKPLGLLRLGFDLHEVRTLERTSRQRLLITVLVLAVLGIVALNAVVIYQNMNLVVRARDQVSTFSGAVLSGMADAVLVFSEDGTLSLANHVARKFFGKHVHRIPDELEPPVQELLRKGAPAVRQLKVRDREGRERLLTLSASRVSVPGEEIPYTVLILRDVTEERRLEEWVKRSEKVTAMGRLAAAVAHEVRNPLNAIGMVAQRLRAEFQPTEDKESYGRFLDVIHSEILRLDELITQFLRFASEPRIEARNEDVGGLADSVIIQLSDQALTSDVRIVSDVPDGLTAVMDARQMRQVLLNLVTNAMDSIVDAGQVRISGAREDPWVKITVEDNGSGMTPEELEQVFELHFTTKDKGTGLGLPISQRIIERHGGFLSLESRKGSGTKATIHIPQGGLKG